jgi:subtilisin family serine protease
VVSVGALGPYGPAGFTNYGEWVRACAEGVDLVSTFFDGFDGRWGPMTLENGNGDLIESFDPDHFKGWARWSGTSFAAPVVVSALIVGMDDGRTADEAVEYLIDDPRRRRIPCLGTVVSFPPDGASESVPSS